jgi:MinD superfamily P-loop ATPase
MKLSGSVKDEIQLYGAPLDTVLGARFKLPEGMEVQFGLPGLLSKLLKKHLTSYPAADVSACTLCGVCCDACPPGAITMKNSTLSVDNACCIRCWCCRELCPHNALQVRQSAVLKILRLLSRSKTV